MSSADTSYNDGRPVEIYRFQRGVQNWFYTSAGDPIVYLGRTYQPTPVIRGDLNLTDDLFKTDVKLTFARDNDFAREYLGFTPETPTIVTLLRGQYLVNDFEVLWKGRIVSGKGEGAKVVLQCEPISTTLKRPGLRARYERNCRHLLYDRNCGINDALLRVAGTVQVIARGIDVTIPTLTQPDGYFTAGIFKTSTGEARFITNHVGQTITIARPLSGLAVNAKISLYPGCDHLKTTCVSKFNNIENFGGFPYIPIINPMGGSSIV